MQIELSVEELDYVLRALGQRPFGEVHLLINKILEQANGQQAQANTQVPTPVS